MNTMIDKDDLEVRKHLKRFIAERIAELEITEADMHRITGDSRKQISRAANGEHTPSLAFAKRLCKALKCTMDELSGTTEYANS